MHIVGTAGHVDHGKSSLVAALTGTDPDRLPQERERGMTLDLGFARLDCGDGTVAGVVDVPGHERLVHNMLAGAAGIELLLLAVALDDGAMPQTFEHLEILRHLDVRAVVVAATKCDLLDADARATAIAALREALTGTIAEGAPLVAVSTVTGEGLDDLRRAIGTLVRALPPRDVEAPAYLPVDRAFVLEGVGSVVTGTLMQGTLRAESVAHVAPSGRSAKMRELQIFGEACDRAEAGARVAIGLPALERGTIGRGDVITDAPAVARDTFAIAFRAAPAALARLKKRTPVRVYLGTAEILGTLVFDAVPTGSDPVPARLHLRRPALAFSGTRFVLRGISPMDVLGGGVVDPGIAGLREALEAEAEPQTLERIAFRANVRPEAARDALAALVASGDALRLERPEVYVAGAHARRRYATIVEALASREAAEPWAMGTTALALARALRTDETTLTRFLAAFAGAGRLVNRGGYFATPGFDATLAPEQQAFFDGLPAADRANPLVPLAWDDVAKAMRASHVPGLSRAFDTLVARGAFVRVGESLYRGAQAIEIQRRVEAYLSAHPSMTAAAFRDALGTSRRYAVPLLEWLDARGITVRVGDERVPRKGTLHPPG